MTSATETVSGSTAEVVNYKYDAFGDMTEEDVTTCSGMTATTTGTKYVIDAWNPAKSGAIGLSGTDVIADLRASDGSLETRYVWGDNVGQLFGRYDTGGTLTADPAGVYFTLTDSRVRYGISEQQRHGRGYPDCTMRSAMCCRGRIRTSGALYV